MIAAGTSRLLWSTVAMFEPQLSGGDELIVMRPRALYIVTHERPATCCQRRPISLCGWSSDAGL